MKKLPSFVNILLVALLAASMLPGTSHAAANRLYLTPASAAVTSGQTIALQLRIGPSSSTTGINAHLSYDTARLSFIGASQQGNSFGTVTTNAGTVGELSISASNGTGSGDRL